MNEDAFLESAEQFVLYLAELQGSLDPESYALLLRILKGTNDALSHRNVDIDIQLSPREQELFTPEFGQKLRRLLDHLNPYAPGTLTEYDPVTNRDESEAEREYLRREVEGIARASGLMS
ncbi:hypothetical protein [Streptomyces ipomoeae]|uniref:hypothetical protein n=1 Tax=Streptomyces ipomoeae TaxID=103232 RepID=UPI00114646CA|nr:hypothetical protein [Streptomyces ipomoeae]MDX2935937.1 hypothetical protein [Streptomyces ipomoeae]TQE26669.1 hypothetical protein SipoB123_13740 [Streptomyces ipomoeae]